MKKMYYIITLIIFILLVISSFILTNSKTDNDINNKLSINTNYSFYKQELHDRYLSYKEKNNFNDKETILKVNIGLDTPFYTNPKLSNRLNSIDILVNKYNYLPSNFIPNNLVITDEYSKGNIKLVSEVYDAFKKMANDAKKENLNIRIISAYRSYDYQKNLYNNYLKNDTQEVVDTYSARPGFSEHQTGLAIDIDNIVLSYDKFHLTQEFGWMKNNCYKYGFILRYDIDKENITGYKYEPWHYRYVGIKISEYIYRNNITFEEYYYEFIG